MAFPRRVLLTVASGSLLYSGMVSALGMGEITLHSALNQPLDAEIELVDVGSLSADQIRIALAPAEAFDAAGVERLAFLQDLRFAPLIQGDNGRIRVVSSNPVREPYLNFLVQISRGNSRILREYTVLLDPAPLSSSYQSSASPAVVQAAISRVATPPAALPPASNGATHRVQGGESLWLIARSRSASGTAGSIAALMRDIQLLNPGAFIGGDPSRLKAGATLLLPDSAGAPAVSVAEPVVSAPAPEPAPETEPTELAALRREMLDELASSREENQRLKEMLTQVQTQLESVQAQLEQTRLATTATPAVLPTGEAASPTDAAAEIQATAEPVASAVVAPSAAVQATASVPAAAPVQVADADFGSEWWRSWWVPGGLVVLLAGLGWSRRRRANAELSNEPEPEVMPLPVTEAPSVVVARPLAAEPVQAAPAVAAAVPVAAVAATPVTEPDVLQAADLYLTYGRRDEALGVLLRGTEASPERIDLRLRALQLLAQAGNRQGYSEAAAGYLEVGGDPAELERLLATYPAMAVPVVQAAAEPEPELLPAVLPASAQDFDEFPVTLDELSLDADWDLIGSLDAGFDTAREPRAAKSETVGEVERAALFELDLDALEEVEVVTRPSSTAEDETLILGELPDLFDPFDEAVGENPAGALEPQTAAAQQAESRDEATAEGEQPKPGKPRMSLVRSA